MRKILTAMVISLLFTICSSLIVLADADVWDGTVDSEWGNNYATTSSFTINNANEFVKFRNMVLAGNRFTGKTVTLNCDIDLNNLNWKYGIGYRYRSGFTGDVDGTYFYGTFNGNSHVIKNLSMNPNMTDTNYSPDPNKLDNFSIGLFMVGSSGTIKNLGVENISITLHNSYPMSIVENQEARTAAGVFYGGLVSICSYGTVSDCYVKNISFNGGWTEASFTDYYISGLIGRLSASATGGIIKNCYVDGVDFKNIVKGGFNSRTYKSGIACITGVAILNNSYSANLKYNIEDIIENRTPIAKAMYYFDSTYYQTGTSVSSATNVYADTPYQIKAGVIQTVNNATGNLVDAIANISVNLGNGFIDLSIFDRLPILSWEKKPIMYDYESFSIYKDYGSPTQKLISNGQLEKGILTAVVKKLTNKTKFDLNVVVSFICTSDGLLKEKKSVIVPLPAFTTIDSDITLPLDLTTTQFGENAFAQAVSYRGIDNVVPLFSSLKLEK